MNTIKISSQTYDTSDFKNNIAQIATKHMDEFLKKIIKNHVNYHNKELGKWPVSSKETKVKKINEQTESNYIQVIKNIMSIFLTTKTDDYVLLPFIYTAIKSNETLQGDVDPLTLEENQSYQSSYNGHCQEFLDFLNKFDSSKNSAKIKDFCTKIEKESFYLNTVMDTFIELEGNNRKQEGKVGLLPGTHTLIETYVNAIAMTNKEDLGILFNLSISLIKNSGKDSQPFIQDLLYCLEAIVKLDSTQFSSAAITQLSIFAENNSSDIQYQLLHSIYNLISYLSKEELEEELDKVKPAINQLVDITSTSRYHSIQNTSELIKERLASQANI